MLTLTLKTCFACKQEAQAGSIQNSSTGALMLNNVRANRAFSASYFFTADSLQCVSTQPATVVMQYSRHAYETHAHVHLPTYFA